MTSHNFVELMRHATKKLLEEDKARPAVDWNARRNWWTKKIEDLYARVEEWLSPLSKDGTISVTRYPMDIHEERLGHYRCQKLELSLGQHKIIFQPVGSIIIGAYGRVDVDGPNGRARLILTTPADVDDSTYMETAVWQATDSENRLTLLQLDQEELFRIVARLFGLELEE